MENQEPDLDTPETEADRAVLNSPDLVSVVDADAEVSATWDGSDEAMAAAAPPGGEEKSGVHATGNGDVERLSLVPGLTRLRDSSGGGGGGGGAGGVVIRVVRMSGPHSSFLHMRVFPSTTAGQVGRSRSKTVVCLRGLEFRHFEARRTEVIAV